MSAAGLDDRLRDEVVARVSALLRRESVPPVELLEQCCAILDGSLREARPGSAGSETAGRFGFSRPGPSGAAAEQASAPAAPAAQEEVFYASLPLRSLQPGYPQYDTRSLPFVERYAPGAAREWQANAAYDDARRNKIDALAERMERMGPAPGSGAAALGTKIGGGFSHTRPMHMQRYKTLVVRSTDLRAWAELRQLMPELSRATECTVRNFPAPASEPDDPVAAGRAPDAELGNTAARTRRPAADGGPKPFATPVTVELLFKLSGGGDKEHYRKLTLQPAVADLLLEFDGDACYNWHPKSFATTAKAMYATENSGANMNVIERRLAMQDAERQRRVGDRAEWK